MKHPSPPYINFRIYGFSYGKAHDKVRKTCERELSETRQMMLDRVRIDVYGIFEVLENEIKKTETR